MVVLYIEGSTSEFTVYLDPPLICPKWLILQSASMGIPESLIPPEEIHLTCDLIDTEDVRYATNEHAQRTNLLAIIPKSKSNQIAFHGTTKPKISTKSLNHVYAIKFRVEYASGSLIPFPPEKVKLELEIC